MPTRNVNLTDELDSFVLEKIESGRYDNASEVVRAALRTLEREERQFEAKLAAPRPGLMKAMPVELPREVLSRGSGRCCSVPGKSASRWLSIGCPACDRRHGDGGQISDGAVASEHDHRFLLVRRSEVIQAHISPGYFAGHAASASHRRDSSLACGRFE